MYNLLLFHCEYKEIVVNIDKEMVLNDNYMWKIHNCRIKIYTHTCKYIIHYMFIAIYYVTVHTEMRVYCGFCEMMNINY